MRVAAIGLLVARRSNAMNKCVVRVGSWGFGKIRANKTCGVRFWLHLNRTAPRRHAGACGSLVAWTKSASQQRVRLHGSFVSKQNVPQKTLRKLVAQKKNARNNSGVMLWCVVVSKGKGCREHGAMCVSMVV